MAHQSTIVENGMTYNVTEFDHTAQEIDDAVSNLGGASTPQGAIAALGAGVRPKLNDNPFFLINQRGQNSYTGARYGPDRWRVTRSHRLDMLDGGGVKLTVVSSSNTDQMIHQYLEPEIFERLNGKQVTLAVIVTENSMSRPSYFRVGATTYGNIPAGQIGLFFATLTLNYYSSANNYFGLQCSDRENQNGESISLKAFTFEAGENQTLGYVDDSGTVQLLERPDPLEILRCQRYQIFIGGETWATTPYGFGYAQSQTDVRIFIPTPIAMRGNPTVEFISGAITDLRLYGGATVSPTAVESHVCNNGVFLRFTTSGAISGACYSLKSDNAKIILNANLG